jgi:hypothetical protein
MDVTGVRVTPGARRYAVRELARRAGVTAEFFERWSVDVRETETVVELPLPSRPRIHFEHAPPEHFAELFRGVRERARIARARWPGTPPKDAQNADFALPFTAPGAPDGAALFALAEGSARTPFDVLASALLTLSRAEELLPGTRDAWGRVPATASVLGRAGLLFRPIVDEYGAGLRRVIERLAPGWSPEPKRPRVHVSHDLDEVGMPFRLRQTVGHALKRGSLRASLRDLAACVTPAAPAFLHALRELVQTNEQHGLRTAVYVKSSPATPFDSGYALAHPRLRPLLHWLRARDVDLGVHPSHYTLGEPARLRREVDAIRHFLGGTALGGRQHHLRWSPESWLDWERSGLAYDSSVGFADAPGFRAGTCFPYRPWLLWLDREAKLLELPLVVMDTTLLRYQSLSRSAARDSVTHLLGVCQSVGGVFTLLWHNTNFVHPEHVELYRELTALLAPFEPFDARGAVS